MEHQREIDITNLATLGAQFPLRLMQLGFQLVQVMDVAGNDLVCYVNPPVCTVPAGSFLLGSDRQQDTDAENDELPQHTVTLDTYHIGMYPLTVAEYACFVQATQRAAPDDWSDQQLHPDHPVVYVSWHNVLAYSRWLAWATGQPWRLPTEAEWENAARGTDRRIYPWGDHWDSARANTRDDGPETTTPVWSYVNGASPYGAQDMVGNVREWTSTAYRPYPYQANDGREDLNDETSKVLRGGTWKYGPQGARAAYRTYNHPTFTFNYVGARLARDVRI